MPNTTGNQQPFVERFEMAIMQYVILNKAQEGEVTRENLKQTFRGNLQMSSDHFDHCITQLVQDKHLKEVGGNKFTVTDDGREDIQKLQTLVMELPNVVQQGGGQQGQRQGMTQQKTTGGQGSTSGGSGGSSSAGSTVGNQGSFGSSSPQGKDAGSQSGSDQPGKINNQSGVSGQQRTADTGKGGSTR